MRKIYITFYFILIALLSFGQTAVRTDDSTYSVIRQLQEVKVVAEKRELTVSNIPSAISVLSSGQLPLENNLDLKTLSGIIPNFYLQEDGLKLSTPIYVRGIGTVSGTPPVGLYVDGVPIFDKNAFIFDLYDIEQIEVLRGPQTTLYGRNSIIGLINIRTGPPATKFTTQAKVGLSNYNSQNYMVRVDLPIRHFFYNKFSFAYNHTDGYFKNRYTQSRSNKSKSYDIRYCGTIYPSTLWNITMGANFNHSFDDGYSYHAIDSLREHRYWVNYNSPSSYKRDLFSTHLKIEKEFNKTALHLTTSYSYSKDRQLLDADFTYWDVFENNKGSKQNMVTEEINFKSIDHSKINWTIGGFGFYKYLQNEYLAIFGDDKLKLLPSMMSRIQNALYLNNTKTSGVAGYGQITINDILPGLSFSAGIRYDIEKVKIDYRDSLLFTPSETYMEYHVSKERKKYHSWLPKFSLLKNQGENFSLYLTVAKGYKAGGYNIIANDMSSQDVELNYDKESLWNYEIGVKYFSDNNQFNINSALFYVDWKDQQIFVMEKMGPSIKNAGDARSYGAEMDLQWEVIPQLFYHLSAGYTNSKYYNHTEEYKGNRVVMAPEFTINTGLAFTHPIKIGLFTKFNIATSVVGFGKQYFDEANTLTQNPYFLWNINFGLSGKNLDFQVWSKNTLNKKFFSYMFESPVGANLPEYKNSGQSGAPLRIGTTLSIKF